MELGLAVWSKYGVEIRLFTNRTRKKIETTTSSSFLAESSWLFSRKEGVTSSASIVHFLDCVGRQTIPEGCASKKVANNGGHFLSYK
jgi:hypothetical protein